MNNEALNQICIFLQVGIPTDRNSFSYRLVSLPTEIIKPLFTKNIGGKFNIRKLIKN